MVKIYLDLVRIFLLLRHFALISVGLRNLDYSKILDGFGLRIMRIRTSDRFYNQYGRVISKIE